MAESGFSDTDQTVVYVGLGANTGDAVGHIVSARRALYQLPGVLRGRSSSIYSSSPVGYQQQPDFINCVLELTLQPHRHNQAGYLTLFSDMQQIETRLGRRRDPNNQNAPRVIDIDFLLCGKKKCGKKKNTQEKNAQNLDGEFMSMSINHAVLQVPHPRMHERLFVLQPLQELNDSLSRDFLVGNQDKFADQTLHKLAL